MSTIEKSDNTNCDEYGNSDKIVSDYEILRLSDTSNINPDNNSNMAACSMPNIRIFNKRKSKRQDRTECNHDTTSLLIYNAKNQENTRVEFRMKNKVRVKSLDARPENVRYHIPCLWRKSENDSCNSSSYHGCASSTHHRHKHHRLCKKFQRDFSADEQDNLGSPRSSNLSWNVVDDQELVLRKTFVSKFRSSMSLPYTSIFSKSQKRLDIRSQHTVSEHKSALFDGDRNTTRQEDRSSIKSR